MSITSALPPVSSAAEAQPQVTAGKKVAETCGKAWEGLGKAAQKVKIVGGEALNTFQEKLARKDEPLAKPITPEATDIESDDKRSSGSQIAETLQEICGAIKDGAQEGVKYTIEAVFAPKEEPVKIPLVFAKLTKKEEESLRLVARVISVSRTPELINNKAEYKAICEKVKEISDGVLDPLTLPFREFKRVMDAHFEKLDSSTAKFPVQDLNEVWPNAKPFSRTAVQSQQPTRTSKEDSDSDSDWVHITNK